MTKPTARKALKRSIYIFRWSVEGGQYQQRTIRIWTNILTDDLSIIKLPPIAIAADENEVEQAKSPDKSIAYNMNGVLQRVCRPEDHGF
nr:hypothetical protein CFP56_79458 [Quercus suber]